MDQIGPEISFVLPCYNEAENVGPIADALIRAAAGRFTHEIVFVDDGSADSTLAEIRSLTAGNPAIRYVSFTRNFGHQAALRAGLRCARGKAVVLMDCDFEHPPELVARLVEEWREGAKVVVTQRLDGYGTASTAKRLSSWLFYRVLNAIGDVEIQPGSADFLLLDRVVADTVNSFEDQHIFLRGLVRWLGFPIAQVTFSHGPRQAGTSKFTLRRMLDLAITGIVAHSIRPLRVAIYLALAFALLGALLLVYSFVSFLWVRHTIAGWTSIMAAIAILGAGQLLVLGIIGEYVGRIMRETRRWPIYMIASTNCAREPAESSTEAGDAERIPVSLRVPANTERGIARRSPLREA